MSDRVTIGIDVDDTQAQMSINEVEARADSVVKQWKIDRNTILRQVREGFTLISSLMSSFRQAMSFFGQQIDPFFSALIGMVLATASMLISASTTLAMTGIGGAAAAVILGIALGFQFLTVGKLLADKAETMGILNSIQQALYVDRTKQHGAVRYGGGLF